MTRNSTATATAMEEILGTFEGYPITESEIIVNHLGADLGDSVAIAPVVVDPNGFAYLAVKIRPTARHYKFVRNADDQIVSVTLVQRFDSVGAMFVEEKTVGKPLQRTIDAVRKAEALAKRGQTSFEVPDVDDGEGESEDPGAGPGPGAGLSSSSNGRAPGALGDLSERVNEAFAGGEEDA